MKLTFRHYAALASMVFGLFFGAGNLIFPALMGQEAGSASVVASLGFLITGVGIPLLGVVAIGISKSDGLLDLANRVSMQYGIFFTCLLYLTIGPLFAIPRTATVSFSIGIESMNIENSNLLLFVFSLIFFGLTLFFSLKPTKILTWVGRVINPLFLVFLGILLVTALINPMGSISNIEPSGAYVDGSFLSGFLGGYNTLDALAGLAFGIVIINVVKGLGVEKPNEIAKCTVKAGVLGFLLMSVIYIAITMVSAQSRNIYDIAENGGATLSLISKHYFGSFGGILLSLTVFLACLKTAIGLVTSCCEIFQKMFPKVMSYRGWAFLFSGASLLIANFGLNAIITWSLPVLMFLYPLAITLILLNLFGKYFGYSKAVFAWTTYLTIPASLLDLIHALPDFAKSALHLEGFISVGEKLLPFYSKGLGWIVPSIVGFVIGYIIYLKGRKTA